MPELPEVETIVRDLRRAILGKKLERVFVFDKKIKKPSLKLPQKIKAVRRLGKYIVLELASGRRLVFHLRMTGKLFYEKFADGRGLRRKAPTRTNAEKVFMKSVARFGEFAGQHERVALCFVGGSCLRFFDVRRFGTLDLHKDDKTMPRLGVDPFSPKFSPKNLRAILQQTSRAIKTALLDQKLIAGIGNIYADEALWLARIHPLRKSNRLTASEAGRLTLAIKIVLREAIKKGGFTLRDYRRLDGSSGYYQHSRKVYDREGEKCLPRAGSRGLRCKTKIKRIKINGRSSYYCPKCQK